MSTCVFASSRVFAVLVATVVAGAALRPGPAAADLGFPAYVALPAQIRPDPDQSLIEETLGEAEFLTDAAGAETKTLRGRHFARWFAYRPAAGEPAPGYYNGTEERILAAMRPPFEKAGWRLVFLDENKSRFTMRLDADGRDAWLAVKMDAPQAQVHVELIEIGAGPVGPTLPKPAQKPEKFSDRDDISFLPPPPGSIRTGGGRGDGLLDMTRPGSGEEPRLVGTTIVTRNYQGPKSLSQIEFVGGYRNALIAAGWTVFYPSSDAEAAGLGGIAAHYAGGGRNIWARLSYEYGASLAVQIVDLGAEDWSATFSRECRLALYGVFFDFDKATLKPESDAALAKVADLLARRPSLKAEIQGHTDAVGSDAYNLKLSDARASAVRQWLGQHGVEPGRLTSKGYGRSQPVADNATEEGRAKNRRVEIAAPGCAK